ncbi:recombination regulator RecX [Capnocytophaga sp. oral taxon 338 str. F0234]|nr:recombination regulator RecX [Capnocytophaga sp. oral taxon 338 str. F0234]
MMEETVKTYTVKEAKARMERFCAYQERCHKEVLAKLRQMRMIPQAIDTIMAYLIKENYLNEERFARSYARGKFHFKKWGRVRITHELKIRDISHYNIQCAMEEIEEEYEETFDTLAEKKARTISEKNIQKARRKLADYLLYKGWESSWVYQKAVELFPYER